MDALELIDETFDKDRTEVYELSIQVTLNGFSFAVKDTIRNTYIVLVSQIFSKTNISHQDWGAIVDQMVSSYPFLSKNFKKVFFEYSDAGHTLIPADLFEVSKQKDLFQLVQNLPEHFELHHTTHTNGESFVQIFSMPYTLSTAWLRVQSKTKFISPLSSLLCYSEISKIDNLIQVDICDKIIFVLYHSKGKLVAANRFEFKNDNDVAYYILSFCNGLSIDFSNVTLHFSGRVGELKDLQRLLSNYFTNISSDAHYNSIHFSYQLLRHRVKFFRLFNSTAICE